MISVSLKVRKIRMATMKKAMKKKKNHTLYSKAQNDLAYTINWL